MTYNSRREYNPQEAAGAELKWHQLAWLEQSLQLIEKKENEKTCS
jgi:hypothetical protein